MLRSPMNVIDGVKIYGNGHRRLFENFCDLNEFEQKDLDWVDPEDPPDVFHYRGQVYSVDEFMVVEPHAPAWMQGFDGYHSDSAFSGLLIRLDPEDHDHYYIYTYIS